MSRIRKTPPPAVASDELVEHVERTVGHQFRDRELVRRALTHPVSVEGMSGLLSYERLEFLGDAVITLFVAEEAYRRFPDALEGDLTRIKTATVSGNHFSAVALELGLERVIEHLNLSERGRHSALENIFEAIVGAMFLDAGVRTTKRFVLRVLGDSLSIDAAVPLHPKAEFLEKMAARGRSTAFEPVGQEGPPHDRVFTVSVLVDGVVVGTGSGRSKKDAETAAAVAAMQSSTRRRGRGPSAPKAP